MTPVRHDALRPHTSSKGSQLEQVTERPVARWTEVATADPRLPLRPSELERLHLFIARAEAGALLPPDVRAALRDLLDLVDTDARST